ncbi:MAG: hypothetical protein FWE40_06450 [Oscillospiraceae bacterium]|nr:hypothetical protein [Oscillospiraceae bacterium]
MEFLYLLLLAMFPIGLGLMIYGHFSIGNIVAGGFFSVVTALLLSVVVPMLF